MPKKNDTVDVLQDAIDKAKLDAKVTSAEEKDGKLVVKINPAWGKAVTRTFDAPAKPEAISRSIVANLGMSRDSSKGKK